MCFRERLRVWRGDGEKNEGERCFGLHYHLRCRRQDQFRRFSGDGATGKRKLAAVSRVNITRRSGLANPFSTDLTELAAAGARYFSLTSSAESMFCLLSSHEVGRRHRSFYYHYFTALCVFSFVRVVRVVLLRVFSRSAISGQSPCEK